MSSLIGWLVGWLVCGLVGLIKVLGSWLMTITVNILKITLGNIISNIWEADQIWEDEIIWEEHNICLGIKKSDIGKIAI